MIFLVCLFSTYIGQETSIFESRSTVSKKMGEVGLPGGKKSLVSKVFQHFGFSLSNLAYWPLEYSIIFMKFQAQSFA